MRRRRGSPAGSTGIDDVLGLTLGIVNGGEENGRRWLRWAVAAAALLAVLVAADIALRNREMEQLLDAIEVSEGVMEEGRDALTNATAAAAGENDEITAREREVLLEIFRRQSSISAEEVIDSSDVVADVSIMPWHSSLREARSKYLRHSDAWEDYFTDGARNPETLSRETPEIGATFRIALRSLRDAAPMTPFGPSFDRRIDEISED